MARNHSDLNPFTDILQFLKDLFCSPERMKIAFDYLKLDVKMFIFPDYHGFVRRKVASNEGNFDERITLP
ncbi:hypothetical protein OUZ56_019015 [Daphnia magna]|uniref:Uncharacterized protein n=1 Tax=Daphnia magna TaxID=35525 RepID=A0ABQ9ZAE7_9CRUS|nr:hypothetical protein OUZ56_019015 [Daphnia magna]